MIGLVHGRNRKKDEVTKESKGNLPVVIIVGHNINLHADLWELLVVLLELCWLANRVSRKVRCIAYPGGLKMTCLSSYMEGSRQN
jgi:hypothetical protein